MITVFGERQLKRVWWILILSSKWRQQASPKHMHLSIKQYIVKTQKIGVPLCEPQISNRKFENQRSEY
jgi:hypothetical protein